MKFLNRTIIILSLVSMFADIASEMIYPVIPLYLEHIGFSVFLIGILEGFAAFTAGISKGYFGKKSDEIGLRIPFIKNGYFLSAISKPMLAVLIFPWWIFLSRTIDRLGKGLRTAARDALLSQNSEKHTKARVFGFHRTMDTFGAAIGPILALTFLYFYPGRFSTLFLLAFIPGLISVVLVFFLIEKRQPVSTLPKGNFFSFFKYWKTATPEYKKLVTGLLVFALFNSSDVFLLLKTAQLTEGLNIRIGNGIFTGEHITIAAYILYNLVFALTSLPFGFLADKIGIRRVFFSGVLVFAFVYLGFAYVSAPWMVFVLFAFYGIYAAGTEGIAKAWITNIAHEKNTATAIGFFTSCQSICALLSSTVAGFVWLTLGSNIVFTITAIVSFLVLIYLMVSLREKRT